MSSAMGASRAGAGARGGGRAAREKRAPLLPWSSSTWQRWRSMRRMCTRPIPRTKFVLLKAPASTLYEEKYGGDVGVFTVGMFVERMTSKNVAIGLAVDCTALDLDAFEPLPASASSATGGGGGKEGDGGEAVDGRIRYFHNPSEWDDYDVDHLRLTQPPPHSQTNASALVGVPTPETVRKFIEACSSHFRSRPNTHVALFDSRSGLGAAAFLVASYMVERMRAPLHVALAGVAEVSPPGIFDEGLLRELQLRCKGRRELTVPRVGRPGWYIDPDADDDDDDEEDGDDDEGGGDGGQKRKEGSEAVVIPPFSEEKEKEKATATMPPPAAKRQRAANEADGGDVPGLQPLHKGSGRYERALTVFRQLIEGLTRGSGEGGDNGGNGNAAAATSTFPSAGHTLLTREVLESDALAKRRYSVTWRALGRRGFLLLLADGVFFLEKPDAEDGEGEIRFSHATGMFFPRPTDPKRTQHRTLLDGVLVMDREGEKKTTTTPRYLAFDLLAHEGGIVSHKPLSIRRKYLTDGVYGARKRAEATDASARSMFARECFRFRVKDYFDARKKTRFVLESFVPNVTHDVDGLVFTPEDAPYGGGGGDDGDAGKGGGILVWKEEGCGGVTGSEVAERIEGIGAGAE